MKPNQIVRYLIFKLQEYEESKKKRIDIKSILKKNLKLLLEFDLASHPQNPKEVSASGPEFEARYLLDCILPDIGKESIDAPSRFIYGGAEVNHVAIAESLHNLSMFDLDICKWVGPIKKKEGAKFCIDCDKKLGSSNKVNINCKSCGTENQKGKKFCINCGKKFVDKKK